MVYSPNKYRETEGTKVRRLGYALDAATLQQVAYNHGITQNIANMTQAQKSQLRYTAILEQSKNVMGDMARTIITPANSMRILAQQMEQFKRAIGNIVSVIAAKLIPYMQAALKLLTEFANWLAQKMGFELPKIDYSNLGDGLSAVGEEADYATDALKAMEEASNFLAGFDEMERIPSLKDSSTGTADVGAGYDLNIDLPEYDFLAGLDGASDEIYRKMKAKINDLIERFNLLKTSVKGVFSSIKAGDVYGALESVEGIVEAFMGKDWVKTWERFGEAAFDGFEDGNWTPMREWLYDNLAGPESWLAKVFPDWTKAWEDFGGAMYDGIQDGDWSGLLKAWDGVVTMLFGKPWTDAWKGIGKAMKTGIKEGNWMPLLVAWDKLIEVIFGKPWTTFWEGVGEHIFDALNDHDYDGIYEDFQKIIYKMFGLGSEWFEFWEGVGEHVFDCLNPADKLHGKTMEVLASAGGQVISDLTVQLKGYASGGYPTSGQLFMARENNMPEMVGRIGTRTAVANNDQITTAIANAVRQAMIEAAMVNGSSDRVINVDNHLYLDGKEVTDTVIRGINSKTKRNGKSPLLT